MTSDNGGRGVLGPPKNHRNCWTNNAILNPSGFRMSKTCATYCILLLFASTFMIWGEEGEEYEPKLNNHWTTLFVDQPLVSPRSDNNYKYKKRRTTFYNAYLTNHTF